MELSGLGIILRRLRKQDIEMVRAYRNSPDIQQYMEYRGEISPAEQEKWFASVDDEFNFYFIIEWEGRDVGMIYGQNTDWSTRETGNGGIFIWEKEIRETQVPIAAALLLTDFSWIIGLQKIHARVLRDNHRAIAFNKSFGYELAPGQEDIINQHYVLTREQFEKTGGRLIEILARKYGPVYTLTLDNLNDPASAKFAALHSSLEEAEKKRLRLIVR
jgi:UDP-4-amino-4,6-dideoxy-N-acetyl-beta-L-altrosamine N-acetyltransferase